MSSPQVEPPPSDSETLHVFEPHKPQLPPLAPYLREMWARRRFMASLARTALRGEQLKTVAGQAWAVLDPLLQAVTYFILIGILRGSTERSSAERLVLLIGCLFLFSYTRAGLGDGATSVTSGGRLLLNSIFPRALLPAAAVYKGLLELLPAIGVYAAIHLVFGRPVGAGVVLLPLLIFIQTVLNLGLALLTSTITVYFPDFRRILRYLTRLLLFITPVLYPVDFLTDEVKSVLAWNPLYPLFAGYQEILLGNWPTLFQVSVASAWAVGFLLVGAYVFLSRERSFALHV